MLITFEGIDGSGKSTQAAKLYNELYLYGLKVRKVHEPGTTIVGKRIREILLDKETKIVPEAELRLFEAARAQLVKEVIVPAIEDGEIVICDRFYDSTTAYQGGGRGIGDYDTMTRGNMTTTGGIKPNRTYLIDVPVEIAFQRRSGREADRIEDSGLEFYKRVRNMYIEIAYNEPDRVMLIDGSKSVEVIFGEILSDLSGIINNFNASYYFI